MIDSKLLKNHHYYFLLIDNNSESSLLSLIQKKFEVLHSDTNFVHDQFITCNHLQIRIDRLLGSLNVLELNRVSKNNPFSFWYDIFVGDMQIGNKTFEFICYPYKSMEKELVVKIKDFFVANTLLTPVVKKVLDYMRDDENYRKKNGLKDIPSNKYLVSEIRKFSAELLNTDGSDSVSLSGSNPLKSRIYSIINEHEEISIRPTSMKLYNDDSNIGTIEILFDALGNTRFWIAKDKLVTTITMLQRACTFFSETKSLDEQKYLSKYSLIDDNE